MIQENLVPFSLVNSLIEKNQMPKEKIDSIINFCLTRYKFDCMGLKPELGEFACLFGMEKENCEYLWLKDSNNHLIGEVEFNHRIIMCYNPEKSFSICQMLAHKNGYRVYVPQVIKNIFKSKESWIQ